MIIISLLIVNSSVQSLELKWKYEVDDKIIFPLTVGNDGTIYFGVNNEIFALNSYGTLKWKQKIEEDNVSSGITIGKDGTFYLGMYKFLYALGIDKKIIWKYKTGGEINSTPALGKNGTVYFGSTDSYFYALSKNGELLWKYKTDADIISAPAIDNEGTIYFGSMDKCFYALDLNGNLKWKFRTGDYIVGSPAITYNNLVCFGSLDGCLYMMNKWGNLEWKYQTDGRIGDSPIIGIDRSIYCNSIINTDAEDIVDKGIKESYFYAFSESGEVKWKNRLDGGIWIWGPAISQNGSIFIGLAGLDRKKGFRFCCLGKDGELKWKTEIQSQIASSPTIGPNGTIYIGMDNCLYAFKGDSPLDDSSWPKFAKNLQNTGNQIDLTISDIDLRLLGITDKMNELERNKISIRNIKNIISKAKQSRDSGDLNSSIQYINEADIISTKIFEINNDINKFKIKIEQITRENIKTNKLNNMLEEITDLVNKTNIDSATVLLHETEQMAEIIFQMIPYITSAEKEIIKADSININTNRAKDKLQLAKSRLSDGLLNEVILYSKQAKQLAETADAGYVTISKLLTFSDLYDERIVEIKGQINKINIDFGKGYSFIVDGDSSVRCYYNEKLASIKNEDKIKVKGRFVVTKRMNRGKIIKGYKYINVLEMKKGSNIILWLVLILFTFIIISFILYKIRLKY